MATRRRGMGNGPSLQAAMVARRYYLGKMQKNQIAEDLGVSRYKVARLLDEALEGGIVRIEVDMPTEADLDLGDRVAQHFSLRRVVAVRTLTFDAESVRPVLGAAAASLLAECLEPDGTLGISWGRSVASTVEAYHSPSGTDVVQIVGGLNDPQAGVGGAELVRSMAERTNGRAFPLHAPLLVGSPEIAEGLKRDPGLAPAISRFKSLTTVLIGVGSWSPPNSAVVAEFSAADARLVSSSDAVADVCGILLDDDGRPVATDADARRIGIDLDELDRVPEVIAVAAGNDKARAIEAALRSSVVTTLVTDVATARLLLT